MIIVKTTKNGSTFAELPAYLQDLLVAWMRKNKRKMPSTPILEFGYSWYAWINRCWHHRIIYVVRQATEGLAQLTGLKGKKLKRGVACSRQPPPSREFA